MIQNNFQMVANVFLPKKQIQSNVKISKAHGHKGLEYKHSPSHTREPQLIECLFYVRFS